MSRAIKYSNDRSFDNLILILMHTYMDLKSLSNKEVISENYILQKIDCLNDVQTAYFYSTKLSPKEWDGKLNNDLIAEIPIQEINWFNATLNLAKEIYYSRSIVFTVLEDSGQAYFSCALVAWVSFLFQKGSKRGECSTSRSADQDGTIAVRIVSKRRFELRWSRPDPGNGGMSSNGQDSDRILTNFDDSDGDDDDGDDGDGFG